MPGEAVGTATATTTTSQSATAVSPPAGGTAVGVSDRLPISAPVGTPTAHTADSAAVPPVASEQQDAGAAGAGEPRVVGHGGSVMSQTALKARLERERVNTQRQFWREEYGTDDPKKVAEIKAQRQQERDQFTRLQKEESERQRAAMTEQQRLQTDLEQSRGREAKLAEELRSMKENVAVSQQNEQIRAVVTKYIDEESIDFAMWHFAKHVRELDPADAAKITQRTIDRWFAKWAEEHPRFKRAPAGVAGAAAAADETAGKTGSADAKPPAAGVPPVAKPPVRRVPLTTSGLKRGGPPAAKPPAANPAKQDSVGGKTIRPGQANSMSKQELNEYLASQGRARW